MVSTGEGRVTIGDCKQANEIVVYELLTLEYHVYLSSHQIEISGKVTDEPLPCEAIMQGCGRINNPTISCSDTRLPLAALSLPRRFVSPSPNQNYQTCLLGVGILRLLVRLYIPRVMNYTNRKQLGHPILLK